MIITGLDKTNGSKKLKIYTMKEQQSRKDLEQPSTRGVQYLASCNSYTVTTSGSSTNSKSADEEEFEIHPAKKKKNLVTSLPSDTDAADRAGISQTGED